MTEFPRISELFVAIGGWMLRLGIENATLLPQPWRGEIKTEGDIIKVTLNASREPLMRGDLPMMPPFHALIESTVYFGCIAVVGPFDGILTGFEEQRLIAIFNAAETPETVQ